MPTSDTLEGREIEDIHDLIEYENENTGLDFKATQYSKDEHAEFLRDVIAMANADRSTDSCIIIGVKDVHGEARQFLGITEQFTDSAGLQQLVLQNIEPDLSVSYEPLEHNGVRLGVIRIQPDPYARPYLMKKDFGGRRGRPLRKGEGLIRKGTHRDRLSQRDLETIYAIRHEQASFSGKLHVAFTGTEGKQSIALRCIGYAPFPSDLAATEIQQILDQRRVERERQEEEKRRRELGENKLGASNLYLANMSTMLAKLETKSLCTGVGVSAPQGFSAMAWGGVPYSKRTDEQLRNNLEKAHETYYDNDYYELYEIRAAKINFKIENRGREYLEDASIRVTVDGHDGGLFVAKDLPEKPDRSPFPIHLPSLNPQPYPTVRSAAGTYVITEPLGDLKHGIPVTSFPTDVRIALCNELAGVEIPFTVELFGRNLPRPIEFVLYGKAVCEEKPAESED